MLIIPTRYWHIFNQMNLQFIRPLLPDARLFNPWQAFNLALDDVDILSHKGSWCAQRQDGLTNIIVARVVTLAGQNQF
ncbi:hypothetical protein D3C73_1290390 [compost metagenome]